MESVMAKKKKVKQPFYPVRPEDQKLLDACRTLSYQRIMAAIRAKDKKIPNWKLQDHMCAKLQRSPVRSQEVTEELTLIPMGCARLRLTVFPVISSEDFANEWVEVPEFTALADRPKGRY